jgi:NAD(P)-dependent dehydrogenase (short-subunit alcohol dehydrogenase family)
MAKAKTATAPRVAIVTGGASGIGAATALRLLADGWSVVIADRDPKALDEARRLHGASKTVRIASLDVTDEAAVTALVDDVETGFGAIKGVANSAGIAMDKHVFDTGVADFRRMLDVNVIGSFIVARAAARAMAKRKAGAIVNIASVSGLRGSKGRVAYGTSKGAVVTMTQVMATDLARHGVRVNALAPGPVETPMVKAVHTDADRRTWLRFVPMRRYGTTAEMASVIAFLLDDTQSGYVTGEIIAADGGFRGGGITVEE